MKIQTGWCWAVKHKPTGRITETDGKLEFYLSRSKAREFARQNIDCTVVKVDLQMKEI